MVEDKNQKKGVSEYTLNGKTYNLRNLPKNIRYTDKMLEFLEEGLLVIEGYADCYTFDSCSVPLGHNLYWNLEPTVQMLSPNGEWIAFFINYQKGKKGQRTEDSSTTEKEPKSVLLVLLDENFIFEQAYRKFVEPLKFDAEDTKAFFGERLVDYCRDRANKTRASKIEAEVKRLMTEWLVDEQSARELLEKKSFSSNGKTTKEIKTESTKQKTEKVA